MTRQKAEEASTSQLVIDLGLEPSTFSMMEEGLGGDCGLNHLTRSKKIGLQPDFGLW
jgi:hypothetical protein